MVLKIGRVGRDIFVRYVYFTQMTAGVLLMYNCKCRGPVTHQPDSPRLQKIVSGYKNICLCSPAGY